MILIQYAGPGQPGVRCAAYRAGTETLKAKRADVGYLASGIIFV
jgi:hypothetical protein